MVAATIGSTVLFGQAGEEVGWRGYAALSVAIAWLYARTNGSLFLTMLMHSAINNTKDIDIRAISPRQ